MYCNDDLITTVKLSPGEGFGMQYSFIINTILYAEKFNKTFAYTPFQVMGHNYENDPDFLIKKEKLINIIDQSYTRQDASASHQIPYLFAG